MSVEEMLKKEGYRYAYRWNNDPSLLTATKSKRYKGDFPNKAIMDDWTLDSMDECSLKCGEWSKL